MLIAQPGRMGPLRLRNRIIMGPMGTNYGTTDGFSTERDKLYYGERAKGGAAMIITEAMVITEGARNHTNSLCLYHDRYIPGLAGGYTEQDMIALCQALERTGVIAIDMSGGTNESPELSRYCIQPPSFARRFLEPYARPIAKALSIPTIMAGRVIDPEDAEGILQAGSADFVAVCRALVADAWWPRKAFGEIETPIRKCISCNVCFERMTLERDVACVTNPMVGLEFERIEMAEPQLRKQPAPRPPAARKRVLVLGAGVAGVETARVAAGLGRRKWRAQACPTRWPATAIRSGISWRQCATGGCWRWDSAGLRRDRTLKNGRLNAGSVFLESHCGRPT